MGRPLALVVDDDVEIRGHARRALIEHGIEVLEAATEGDGLAVLRAQDVRVLIVASSRSVAGWRGFLEKSARLRPSTAAVILADPSPPAEKLGRLSDGVLEVLPRRPDAARLRGAVDRALALHDLLEARRRLGERPVGVEALARQFVEEIRAVNDLPPIDIAADALEALNRHPWADEDRDLRDAIERAVTLAEDGVVRLAHLPSAVRGGARAGPDGESADSGFRDAKRRVVESFEKRYLAGLLARHRGNVTAAAQESGMLRSALQRLLRKYDLRSSEFRSPLHGPTLD
jgi:DNA-binding NtrC family response regulator